jgi:LysM repeat protein
MLKLTVETRRRLPSAHPGHVSARLAVLAVKSMKRLALSILAVAVLSASPAIAACPARLGVAYGDTLSAIAAACGISVETLRGANPGLSADNLRAGAIIAVPRPALPSPQLDIGRPLVRVAPAIVPHGAGGASGTVILPPVQPPVPQQHILRGFGNEPGQLPLPPGHSIRVP